MRARRVCSRLAVACADSVRNCPMLIEIGVLEIDPKNFQPQGQPKLLVDLVGYPYESLVPSRFHNDSVDV